MFSPLTGFIGFLCGISGVAGGVFEIPIMINIVGVSSHVAVATSSAIVLSAAFLGAFGRLTPLLSKGLIIDFNLILGIILSAFIGAQIGPRISVRLEKSRFKKICGVFIISLGVFYFLKGL